MLLNSLIVLAHENKSKQHNTTQNYLTNKNELQL